LFGSASRREPEDAEDASKGRDVFNEKPPPEELLAISDIGKLTTTSLPENVVWNSTSHSSLNFQTAFVQIHQNGETIIFGLKKHFPDIFVLQFWFQLSTIVLLIK
jgi:hypothetical protein